MCACATDRPLARRASQSKPDSTAAAPMLRVARTFEAGHALPKAAQEKRASTQAVEVACCTQERAVRKGPGGAGDPGALTRRAWPCPRPHACLAARTRAPRTPPPSRPSQWHPGIYTTPTLPTPQRRHPCRAHALLRRRPPRTRLAARGGRARPRDKHAPSAVYPENVLLQVLLLLCTSCAVGGGRAGGRGGHPSGRPPRVARPTPAAPPARRPTRRRYRCCQPVRCRCGTRPPPVGARPPPRPPAVAGCQARRRRRPPPPLLRPRVWRGPRAPHTSSILLVGHSGHLHRAQGTAPRV